MRQPDPEWRDLAARPFGRWIDDHAFMYKADQVRRLLSFRERLPEGREIEVEIGSNRGRFLTGLCQGRPETTFIGVEIKTGLCRVARKRLARNDAENGLVLNADARLALPILFEERAMSAIYILFPDPWWKARHAKRRLLDASFLRLIHAHLSPEGHVVIMTDVPFYGEQVQESFDEVGGYSAVAREAVPGSQTWELTTRERHCEEDGLPVHRFYMRKSGDVTPE